MSTSILSNRIIPYRFIHLLDLFINIYIIIINYLYIQWCASKAIKKIRVSSVPPGRSLLLVPWYLGRSRRKKKKEDYS